jgi:hypothetical protein
MSDGNSFVHLGVHVGSDWTVRCNTYPDHTPILDVDAGGTAVAFCIRGRGAGQSAVEFARELVRQAQVFAAEVERMHAAQGDDNADGADDNAESKATGSAA